MLNKRTDLTKATFDTLIGANTEVSGGIVSKGIIRIDGKITGDVTIHGDVFVGESSLIKGNVTASNIHVAGNIEGDISASGTLKLLPSSKLLGDIQVKTFVCEEGSIFEGNCKMADSPSEKTFFSKKKDFKKGSGIVEEEVKL